MTVDSDDSTVPRWILQPAATVREILGNNRRAVYVGLAALGGLWMTGNLPETGLPSWWPAVAIAIGAAGLAGRYAARRIMDLIPDPRGVMIIEYDDRERGGGQVYIISREAFAQMRVLNGELYPWANTLIPVYECIHYNRPRNVAVANWRESKPASALSAEKTNEDVLGSIRELRNDLEPDVAKARETRRRLRGIVRQLDKDRAEAQQALLDDHVAPDLGNSRTISDVIEEQLPDELHPTMVDAEDATEDVDEDDQRHDNGDSPDEEDSKPNMADMEFFEAITDG